MSLLCTLYTSTAVTTMVGFLNDMSSRVNFIYTLSWLTFMIPIYTYLLMKWYHYRDHFVIKNRFPKISLTIFGINFIIVVNAFISSITTIEALAWSGQVLAAVASGLVFYRTHLIYVRWAISTAFLQNMTKFSSDTDLITIKAPS